MRRGFAPHFRQLDDLFAPLNLTMSTILFRSCWVPFRNPPFSACRRSFCPNIDQIYNFIQILLGPILNFEPRTPTDFYPECPPPGPIRLLLNFFSPSFTEINLLWPSEAIWWDRSGSTLAQVMACCLTAPSHYLNQCRLITNRVLCHSPKTNFTKIAQNIISWNEFEKYSCKNYMHISQGAMS